MSSDKISRRKLIGMVAGGLALAAVPGGIYQAFRRLLRKGFVIPSRSRKPGGIVVHHSATKPENQAHENAETIGRDHKARGFGVSYKGKVYHIAYHYVILPDGTVEEGRPERCRGGHTRSWKHNRWIGICLVGYFNPKWKNAKYHKPTQKQMRALVKLSGELVRKYDMGDKNILPHWKVNPTECPGKSFPMKEYLAKLKTEIQNSGQEASAPGVS